MTDSTCATNLAGRGAPVSTWMRYCASFARASSVLAVRMGEAGRDRGGMLAGWVAGDSSHCRRSGFSHVSGREGSESARLRFGIDYNVFADDAAIGFICACSGGRGRGVVVSPWCCCCQLCWDWHVTALGAYGNPSESATEDSTPAQQHHNMYTATRNMPILEGTYSLPCLICLKMIGERETRCNSV